MKTTTTTKTKVPVRTSEHVGVTTEISKGAIGALGGISALIGLWAIACFVGGLVASGGPVAMAKNWLEAVIGK